MTEALIIAAASVAGFMCGSRHARTWVFGWLRAGWYLIADVPPPVPRSGRR